MAKVNKEYQARMDGMLFAHKIATEKGLDALTKDIKMRNILKLDLWARPEDVEEADRSIAENVYQTMLTTLFYTLCKTFNFGKKRLNKLKKDYDENVMDVMNLDRWGEGYVTYLDYAKFLVDKCELDLNTKLIDEIVEHSKSKNPEYKRCELSAICDLLDAVGYNDAAAFLREKELIDSTDKHYAKKVLTLPKYQEYRKRFEKESTLDAFYAFCFAGSDFLESKCQCTQGALVKEFLNYSNGMLYKMDEQYFIDRVAHYKRKGIDVLEILECEFEEGNLDESTEVEL